MPNYADWTPRLTNNERKTLEMAIRGMSIDHMAEEFRQSPRMLQRYLDHGLGKLELWSLQAAPVKNHRVPAAGDVRPREGEKMVARLIRTTGEAWTCFAVAAMPADPQSSNVDALVVNVSRMIHGNIRIGDVVIKWSRFSWVVFLPRTTLEQAKAVTLRIKHCSQEGGRTLLFATEQPKNHESFIDTAARCHQTLIGHHVSQEAGVLFPV